MKNVKAMKESILFVFMIFIPFMLFMLFMSAFQTLHECFSEHPVREHRVGDFREAGPIGAVDVVDGSIRLLTMLHTPVVNALHDPLEALVDLLTRPERPKGVLALLES